MFTIPFREMFDDGDWSPSSQNKKMSNFYDLSSSPSSSSVTSSLSEWSPGSWTGGWDDSHENVDSTNKKNVIEESNSGGGGGTFGKARSLWKQIWSTRKRYSTPSPRGRRRKSSASTPELEMMQTEGLTFERVCRKGECVSGLYYALIIGLLGPDSFYLFLRRTARKACGRPSPPIIPPPPPSSTKRTKKRRNSSSLRPRRRSLKLSSPASDMR